MSTTSQQTPSTSSHPPASAPDPSLTQGTTTSQASPTVNLVTTPVHRQNQDHEETSSNSKTGKKDLPSHNGPPSTTATYNSQPSTHAAPSPQLSSLTLNLRNALRQYPDFPSPGILFEDICPIFRDPSTLSDLVTALELFIDPANGGPGKPDLIVGLDARGFLIGPALALRVGAGFAPVRKAGKLPGRVERAKYVKEYGEDVFEMQDDAVTKGQKVLVVDDIIATGGSASAAGQLVRRLGGDLIGYVFLLELDFLKGREKLDAPVWTLLTGQKK